MLIRLISIYVLISAGTAFGQDPVVIKVGEKDAVSEKDSLVNENDTVNFMFDQWFSLSYEFKENARYSNQNFLVGFGKEFKIIKGLGTDLFFGTRKKNDIRGLVLSPLLKYDLRISEWMNWSFQRSPPLFLIAGSRHEVFLKNGLLEVIYEFDLGIGTTLNFGRVSLSSMFRRRLAGFYVPEESGNFSPYSNVLVSLRYNFK